MSLHRPEHDKSERAASLLEPEGAEFTEYDSQVEDRRPDRQYCVFRSGRERFCLSVLEVEEVVDWPAVTPVPVDPVAVAAQLGLD